MTCRGLPVGRFLTIFFILVIQLDLTKLAVVIHFCTLRKMCFWARTIDLLAVWVAIRHTKYENNSRIMLGLLWIAVIICNLKKTSAQWEIVYLRSRLRSVHWQFFIIFTQHIVKSFYIKRGELKSSCGV